mmetsp:Transcript_22145/g.52059  ORF Transcript_22145/g.52059 Transcript_22145/m.52059 type:complete len:454 (-) Transcript_22145:1039-2400(-)
MGRRLRGAALRAKKRETELSKEIVETAADEVEKGDVTAKADDELFVVDTTAVVPSKKQLAKKAQKASKQRQNSKKEQAQIDRLVQKYTPEELQTLVKQQPGKTPKIKGAIDPTFDLWDQDSSSKASVTPPTPVLKTQNIAGIKPESHVQIKPRPALPDPSSKAITKKKPSEKPSSSSVSTGKGNRVTVEVAMSGQSYNPDKVAHKKALEEALRLETQRETAERELKAPLSKGLSDETKALLLGDTDSEEEDDSDEDEDNDKESGDDAGGKDIKKRPEKLTRAQRNKQKRLRAEAHELQERKRQKRLQNSVEEAKSIAKKMRKEEGKKLKEKEELEELKAASARVKGQNVYQQVSKENPINAPTFPVALPHELGKKKTKPSAATAASAASASGASLRTIKPKGSLVTDRMISIVDRDMAPKKALKRKKRIQGKRRKVKVRGKGYEATKEGEILG